MGKFNLSYDKSIAFHTLQDIGQCFFGNVSLLFLYGRVTELTIFIKTR